jgi:alpha-tubulin suppressor-like RCC1 family protein
MKNVMIKMTGLLLVCLISLTGCGGGGGDTGGGAPNTVGTFLAAPAGLVATPGNGQVTISWNASTGATSYNLYMASVPGVTKSNYTTLADGAKHAGVTSPFANTGLTNGKTYYFVATAVDASGESLESSEVSATPTGITAVPSPPSGVAALAGNGQVRISWNPVSGADNYNLYVASASGVTKNNHATLADGMTHANATSPFIHTGLTNGTIYYFVVTAVNASGESAESGEVSATPTGVIPPAAAVSSVSAGWSHTCAVLSNGTVQCWGENFAGQLGNGTRTGSSTPVAVSGLTTATAVSAGGTYTCAVLSNGTVQCWGENSSGELGNGTTTNTLIPVTVSGLTTATAVSAGGTHTCAVLSNGAVQCWGLGGFGQLGNGTTILVSSTPVAVSGITTATAVSAGNGGHTCALLSNGTVQCWGRNGSDQLGNGTRTGSSTPVAVSGLTTATAVSAGGDHTCALLSNDTVQCWGRNFEGQLGNGTIFVNSFIPVAVSGLTTATAVSAWGDHTCAVLSNGTVQCWGKNSAGQLGNGITLSAINSLIPIAVSGLTATAVTAGAFHTCALLSNGTVQCWGRALANGSIIQSSNPVPVIGLP